MRLHIGLLLFPRRHPARSDRSVRGLRQVPDTEVHLLWKTIDPVTAAGGLRLLPATTFAESPQLDLICVPGGAGMNRLLNDEETLDFVAPAGIGARYVTSVCTGSLVLGAAGLLRGKRATTHWMSLPMLAAFGCEPVGRARGRRRQRDHRRRGSLPASTSR